MFSQFHFTKNFVTSFCLQVLQFVQGEEYARFTRIVFDTAPTGHTLRLLTVPDFVDASLARIVRLRKRLGSASQVWLRARVYACVCVCARTLGRGHGHSHSRHAAAAPLNLSLLSSATESATGNTSLGCPHVSCVHPPTQSTLVPSCVACQAIRGLFGADGSQAEAVDKLEQLQASIRLVKDLFRDKQSTEVSSLVVCGKMEQCRPCLPACSAASGGRGLRFRVAALVC
jgi:anion-transporting  ArsA/GET3 family ATPase